MHTCYNKEFITNIMINLYTISYYKLHVLKILSKIWFYTSILLFLVYLKHLYIQICSLKTQFLEVSFVSIDSYTYITKQFSKQMSLTIITFYMNQLINHSLFSQGQDHRVHVLVKRYGLCGQKVILFLVTACSSNFPCPHKSIYVVDPFTI